MGEIVKYNSTWEKYDKPNNKHIIGIDPCEENTRDISPTVIVRAEENEIRVVDVDVDFDMEELSDLLVKQYNAILIDESVSIDEKEKIREKFGKMLGKY